MDVQKNVLLFFKVFISCRPPSRKSRARQISCKLEYEKLLEGKEIPSL